MRSQTLVVLIAFVTFCVDAFNPIVAEEAPSYRVLVRQAERSAPTLLAIEADYDAARGHLQQARAFANPGVSLEVEDFAGSGIYHGSAQTQTTLALSEPLEIAGQRAARIGASRAEMDVTTARGQQLRADFGYELAMAYASAESANVQVSLLADDLERAQEDFRAARALVDAGKEAELRSVQASAGVSAAKAELERARAELVAALDRLSSLAGFQGRYTAVAPSLLTRPVRAGPVEMLPSPRVAVAQAERESAERRLALERKRAVPTPSVSLGVRRLNGADVTTWVAGVSFPLPLFDLNRGDIAAARADLSAAQARVHAAELDSEAERHTAAAQVAALVSLIESTDQGEVSAREAYRLARIGYEAGPHTLVRVAGDEARADGRTDAIRKRQSRRTPG